MNPLDITEKIITRDFIEKTIHISNLVIQQELEKKRLSGNENIGNKEKYNNIISKELQNFKSNYKGKSPNLLLGSFLEKYIEKMKWGKDFETKNFTYYGQIVNSYVWACISKKDHSIQFNRASYFPQLYILINSQGIKIGFCYGYYVKNTDKKVQIVREQQDLQKEVFTILKEIPDIQLYKEVIAEKEPLQIDVIKITAIEEISNIWSRDVHLIVFLQKEMINENIEDQITTVFDKLSKLFLSTSITGEPVSQMNKEIISPSSNPIISLLQTKKQIILYGPPGTGKTYQTKKIALEIFEDELNG
jgi:5-methylcytosine-specific restriction enzyme B